MVILQQFKIMQEHLQKLNPSSTQKGAINPVKKLGNAPLRQGDGALV